MTPTPKPDLPILPFASPQDWADWLEAQHAISAGIWLKLAKAGSGIPSVTYAEALEAALCYGWIDGQKKALDERFWLQKFTPRRARSIWSKINREKAEALIRDGRMRPSGLREIERAQQDGRWQAAYDSQSTAMAPADFQAELDKNPAAQAFFAALDSANRYAVLFRIQTAAKAGTRAKRIRALVEMLEKGEKLHP